jgi:isoquinoline 1-oxidoreductase subunit beta
MSKNITWVRELEKLTYNHTNTLPENKSITPTPAQNRRSFLKTIGTAGAFFAIGFGDLSKAIGGNPILQKITLEGNAGEVELNNFILITSDNKITLFNPRPEMGQGTWQSLPALIAEELEVSLDKVEIRLTAGAKRHGVQGVGGSGSVRQSWEPMRQVGAAAKEMLIQAAAKRWGTSVNDCRAENASITQISTGKTFTYGDLVADAATLEVPTAPKLKDPKDFKILGKPALRSDVPSKVNGSAIFGIDAKVPGMLYASIVRCPTIHGKVKNFNAEEVLKMSGVKHVLKTERQMPHKAVEAVAVIGDSYWQVQKARKALQIEWDNSGYDEISTEKYFAETREKAAKSDGNAYSDAVGDFNVAIKTASKSLEAVYETPFAAHAMIEPMNATVSVQGDKAEIWTSVQNSPSAISQVAKYIGIPAENITINNYFMGGSFGRKGYLDFVLEAAKLSQTIKTPVKLIWTREDDLENGPYRPGMINALKGGLDASGNLTAWEHKVCGASIAHQAFGADLTTKPDDWSSDAIDQEMSPYEIPNRRQAHVHNPTDIPIVWWRSVYASTNSFGHESFMDEMALAAGKDALDFRLNLLQKSPRWVKLLQFLEQKSDYRREKAAGKSIGIAVANSFGSTAAYAVFVSKKGNGVKIDRVVCAMDCGMTVNPDTVRAQTEGNMIYALSAAVKPAITFDGGEAQQSNFHQYPMPRINEVPKMEIYIIENGELPGGIGEPGLPPFTPALCNAIFRATGKRIRKLPFDLENI